MSFREYAEHGWALCPIRQGEKAPRGTGWNKRENVITNPARAEHLDGAGLCHAFSGTCAIDIDNMDLARVWFREQGIDLDALFNDDDALQITRGDKTRGKLIYSLPTALPTKQIKSEDKTLMLVEFRCGATTGNTNQDVLPPTLHPSGKRYEWKLGALRDSWKHPPPVPAALLALWQKMVRPIERPAPLEPVNADIVVPAGYVERIKREDPDCDYGTWCDIGMRLHDYTHGGDHGFQVWDEWSAKGNKYPGQIELRAKWDTFGRGTGPQATLQGFGAVATAQDFGPPLDPDVLAQAERMAREERLAQFQWYTLADAMSKPSPEWIIKRVLPKRPINMMFGPSGAGKSFVALDIALAVSRGVRWREMRVKQGAVGWLAAEAEGSMRNRGHAYAKHHGLEAPPQLHILGTGIDLTNTEQIKTLAESAVPFALSLIIVDTLAAAAGGANENSGEDMNPVLDNCKLIHEITGASVLLIHHSGKDETKGSRGWSGIKARVDAQIEVKKRESSDHVRDILMDKLRDGDEGLVMPFELHVLELGHDTDGDPITSAVVRHLSDAEAGPRKRLDKALAANERVLAREVLNRLWPLDGEPVVDMDAFIAAYVEELPHTPGGKDTRHTEAHSELKKLAKRGEVSIDNARRTVTLLKNKQIVDRLLEAAPQADPDEDLL
jgi:hypothetical protein